MNRRILIIDDNPAIHEDMQKILSSAGEQGLEDLDQLELELLDVADSSEETPLYQLDFATGGEQALALLIQAQQADAPYAMAFVDMRMPPGWDGLQTIEHLWEQDPQLQIVICTAFSDYSWDELQARVTRADNLFLLSKPFDMMEIRQAAAAMTMKRHLAEASRSRLEFLEQNLAQSREELLETTVRLQGILDAAPVGIFTTDQKFCIQSLNQAAQSLFGLSPEQATGKPLSSLVSVARLVAGTHRCSALRTDQSSFPAQLMISPLSLESEPLHICIVVDQTQALQAESESLRLKSQLFQVQKLESLSLLAEKMAHDFNLALTAILGCTEKALLEASEGPLQDMLGDIRASALRAGALTQQTLSFVGKGHRTNQPVSLNELLTRSAPFFADTAADHIQCTLELGKSLPKVEGDPDLLQQMVGNLILNAAEAIGDKSGQITLSTGSKGLDRAFMATTLLPETETGSFVWLACQDTGAGLDPNTLNRIFDPFYSTRSEGRGLGLSTLLGIVKSHKGTLKVESTLGQGSKFSIYLPAYQLPPLKAPSRPQGQKKGHEFLAFDHQETRLELSERREPPDAS